MDKIKKIPVIGYILRLIYAIAKLPMHIDQIYERNQEMVKGQGELLNCIQRLQDDIRVLQGQKDELQRRLQESWNNIQQLQTQYNEQQQIQYNEQQKISEAQRSIDQAKTEIHVLKNLELDGKYFEKLRLLLSSHPVLWGEKDRLHISDLAAVFSCFFNTNSGEITIGDYTFAGSGVSILAGSHDPDLKGLLRRDAEITDGCDIQIGNGVWLASNSTILGPATIGDNAVIAAGAVVVPGTIIPPNTIYAGVPAKQIGILELDNSNEVTNPAIQKALERNDGVLYVDGWTEKKVSAVGEEICIGRYLLKQSAYIYTSKSKICLLYAIQNGDKAMLYCKIDNKELQKYELYESYGKIDIEINEKQIAENSVHVVELYSDLSDKQLFIATSKK